MMMGRLHLSRNQNSMIEMMAREVVNCAGGSYGTVYAAMRDAYLCGSLRITYPELQALQAAERAKFKDVEPAF